MTFWQSNAWRRYELAYGDAPGTREHLLATADWHTQVVDLSQDEVSLWRGLRNSYKPLINRARRIYDVKVLSGLGAGVSIPDCRRVHLIDAGRVTRPVSTWECIGDWADDGIGFVALVYDRDMGDFPPCVGFAYFVKWETWAYYFSAATLVRDVNHALIWAAMLELKAHGVTQLELGWQGHAVDEKARNVEFFKRGFGGRTIPICEVTCGL